MLTVFENGVGYPIQNDDYYVRLLASGYDEVVFNVDIRDPVYQYINEEAVIRERNQNFYLIKQIDAGEKTAKVVAQINLDDWKQALYMDYSNNSATVAATVSGILPTGWNMVDYSNITKRRTIPTSDTTTEYNVTALEVLEACTSVYGVRFRFNTATKTISIINPANYQPAGAFATRDLNLTKLNYKGKSDSFATRLYATGKDGLTFASINDGKSYVENFSYSNKIISAYWGDERYTDKQSLLDDATAMLADMAQPSRSYDCEVLDLANTNPEMYGFEDFSLFSVVTLVDDAKEVRTNYQVVERWEYPYYPVKNKVVLSTSTPNIQSVIAKVTNAIDSSTSSFSQIMQSAIANATELITGNSGGYVVLHDSDGDGAPDEILVMDTPSIATATKVWRWNQQGLGYSNHGYNPPAPYGYELGMTMDGSIVATMITSGTLNADVIRAGTITDHYGNNYWDLDTGEFRLSSTTKVGSGSATVASSSDVSSAITTAEGYADSAAGAAQSNAEGYADSAISTYNTNLNQQEVFKKLTNNGQAQGIVLDENGDLYINGTWIQANTIAANALTVAAQKTLQGVHNYLGDVFGDITLWHNNSGDVPFSYETVDNVTYLVLDYTGVSTVNWANSVYTDIELAGDAKIDFKLSYHVDRDVVIPSAQGFAFIRYKSLSDGNYYLLTRNIAAQTIPANTEFTWDTNFPFTSGSVDATAQAYFGFLPLAGCKVYIKEIELTNTVNDYATAGLEFNAEGLTSTVKKGDVISSINQSSEAVTISATKIDLSGDLSLRGNFTSYASLFGREQKLAMDASSFVFYEGYDPSSITTMLCKMYPYDSNTGGGIALTFYDRSNGNIKASISADGISVGNGAETTVNTLYVNGDAEFYRGATFGYNGTTSTFTFYGDVINSVGGTVFRSDRRKKRSIKDLAINKARSFIMALKPRAYRFIKEISNSDRFHHGFIAQEVQEAMPEDWGIYVEDKDKDFIGLRYDEFLADMVAVIQDQEKRIEALERRVNDLTNNKS